MKFIKSNLNIIIISFIIIIVALITIDAVYFQGQLKFMEFLQEFFKLGTAFGIGLGIKFNG